MDFSLHSCFHKTILAVFLVSLAGDTSAQRLTRYDKTFQLSESQSVYEINLRLDAAEFRLVESRQPGQVKISVLYSEDEFLIDTDFNSDRRQLDFTFDKEGWVGDHDNLEGRVRIELPPTPEIDLRATIKAGAIDMDFGDMSIVALDLTTWAGEVKVDFSSPNKAIMKYLQINTKIGETDIRRLGNARFTNAEINGGIGEMKIDFRGLSKQSAKAEIDLDIGSTQLNLPTDLPVRIRVSKFLFLSHLEMSHKYRKEGNYYYSRNYQDGGQKLDLRVSPGMGDLQIN